MKTYNAFTLSIASDGLSRGHFGVNKAREVFETMAVSKLAVKSIEDVAKRANRITRWARKEGQMGAEANSIKKMAKELNDIMDKLTKGDTVIVP